MLLCLKPQALSRIRFADGEVAAIALISISELRTLLQNFPERAAGGITDSLPLYLDSGQ